MGQSLEDTMPLVLYRLAYGHADRLMEEYRGSSVPGSQRRDPSAAILAAVARQLGLETADPVLCEAVDDAVAGRRPKY